MWQRTRDAAVCGTIAFATLLALTAHSFAAEFRTSVRGKSMVRQANYQQEAEEVMPLEIPSVESYDTAASADCCGDSCWDGNCGNHSCNACCSGWSYWGSFEFLLWWRKGQTLPPLITSSPTTTPENDAGVLGVPGTEVLYATETQSGDARPGGRLTVGVWFDPCQFSGMGTRLYSLGETTANYDQNSNDVPVLARPFYNVDLGVQDALQFAYPNSTSGSVSVRNTSRVSGGDVFFRRLFFQDSCRRIDLIAGYQFARIDTDLSIFSNLEAIGTGGTIPMNSTVELADWFDSRNSYHAGEIGLWTAFDRGPITWSLLAKVGLGNMSQRTEIAGRTVTTTPNLTSNVTNQGLLALNSNSGVYKRNVFTVSPELDFKGAYHLNDSIALTFGYSFIFWNHVAQPGDQIDTWVNPTQITGPLVGEARPAFPENDSSYYVHGLNFGVQWVW